MARELVEESTWRALGAVEGLRRGEGKETRPVPPCPRTRSTRFNRLSRLQSGPGSKSNCGLAAQARSAKCGPVTSGGEDPDLPAAVAGLCHVYRPASHKLEHHDRDRLVLLGPQAVAIVDPWLRPAEPEAHLFSPAEARAWYFARRRASAETPRRKLTRKQDPKRRPTGCYTVTAYGKAISRAIDKATQTPRTPVVWTRNEKYIIARHFLPILPATPQAGCGPRHYAVIRLVYTRPC